MKNLNEDIQTGSFKPVYCLFGEENFLKRSYRGRLKEAITGEDQMNLTVWDGKEVGISQVIDIAETMPFFAERRLIIVDGSGWFKKDAGVLPDYLERMPKTSHLLFVEAAVDKRNRFYKKAASLGRVVELKRQPFSELSVWAGSILKKAGKKITGQTMDYFLSLTGDDMDYIRSELDKLTAYTGGRNVVTVQDIEAVCCQQVTGKVFDMIGAVAGRRQAQALKLYYDLLTVRESAGRILALISRHFHQLLLMKELMEKGAGTDRMAKALGVPPFAVGKLKNQVRAFEKTELYRCAERCAASEEAVKTGKLSDTLAVELLIVEFSGAR
ncbi:MAG: DNA polymerase III subunit delta [Lachnospiraceae bacterium]|nr:DNA polymerase III subunit delta [Lachnospiraceae bacterium]